MSRTTVYRYMRVEVLIKANVSRMAHLENLGLNKIFALLTLKQEDLLKILKGRALSRLTDIQFRTFIRRFRPRQDSMITRPNLIRTLDASLRRLDSAVKRWKSCRQPLPSQIRAQLVSKLRQMIRETCQDSRMAV